MIRKLFRNARIFTPLDRGWPLAGEEQGHLASWERGALLVQDGQIQAVGEQGDVLKLASGLEIHQEMDCRGLCIIPGFVDPHTHLCFSGDREKEFGERLKGVSYLEILARGGGILSTVREVRSASQEHLLEQTLGRARRALCLGTTTLEIKSGYGLDTDSELKMLRAIHGVSRASPVDVVATFMGAHAIPEEHLHCPEAYVELLIQEMLPAVKAQGIARFCDVFCEKGVFTLEQSSRILTAAKDLGLGCKIHADEVNDTGGASLAARLGALSAEHLLAASQEGLQAMAQAKVVAVLLPGTALSLRKPYAMGRGMIQLGVPVALATDCNPGSCYSESMPLVFALAVLGMGLSAEEALVGATLNAAHAIGLATKVGSLEVGKQADFLILDGGSPAVLAYRLGAPSCIREVYKRGERVA